MPDQSITESSFRLKKLFKYLSRFLIFLLLLTVLLFAVCWYLASSNHEMVREKVAELLEEKLGTPAQFSHYSISNTAHFPFLSVQVNDLHIEGADFSQHQKELLQIDQLSFLFHPFDLLQKKYTINKVQADGLTLQIYTDSLGLKNTRSLFASSSEKTSTSRQSALEIDQLLLKNARFDLTNDQKQKHHRFTIQEGVLKFSDQKDLLEIKMDVQCLFDGLLFKKEKGAFLDQQQLAINSHIEIDKKKRQFRFLPSQLHTGKDEIQVEGQLTLADTNYLHLEFKTEGLLLDRARPLLNAGINKTLKEIHVDQPVKAHFVLDGPMISGKPISAALDFSAEDAQLDFQRHHIKGAGFTGRFENNCVKNKQDGSEEGCLYITQMSGRYGGDIPFDLSATIKNLDNAEYVKLKAIAQSPFPVMKRFFGDLPELELVKGALVGTLDFEGNPVSYLWNCETCNDHQLNGSIKLIDAEMTYTDQIDIKSVNGEFLFDQRNAQVNQLQLQLNDLQTRLNGNLKNAVQKFIGNPVRLAADLELQVDELDIDSLFASFPKSNTTQSATPIPLSDQLNKITTELNKRLDLRLGIQSDTITFKGYQASNLDLRFEVAGACHRGNVLGENSCLRISRLKAEVMDGIPIDLSFSLNEEDNPVLEVQAEGELPLNKIQSYFPVKKVNVKSGNAILRVQASAPLNDLVDQGNLISKLKFNGDLALDNISGEHLPSKQKIDQLNGRLEFDEDSLHIESLRFKYADYSPQLSGSVKSYLSGLLGKEESPFVQLALDLPLVDLSGQTGGGEEKSEPSRSYLPSDLIALFDQSFDYFQGQLALSIGELKIPDYEIKDCSMILGLSTNTASDKAIRSVTMDQFNANLWETTLLNGKLKIPDLSDPELLADLHVRIPVEELGRIITSRWLRFEDGFAELDFRYQTKLRDTLDAINYLLDADMDGSLTLTSAEIDYTAREFMFNNINGTIDFNEEVLSTRGTDFVLNNNPAQVSGSCFDYLDFFILPDRKIKFELELDIPVFDFDYFLTPKDLGLSSDTSSVESGSDKFEKLLNSGTMELTTRIQQLIYRRFQPRDVVGKIQLSANRVGLEKLKMSLAEGTFAINGEISEIANHAPKANVEASFTGNNISTVFSNFENFGQKDMTAENIEGYFSADINFQSNLNDDYKVLPSSIRGGMDLSIYKGSLIDLPAFKDLTGILFKNRRMDNIGFDTINTTTHLKGSDLLVDYFYIHATSMDFGVEGRYSFGDGDRTYMIFQVPTGNIFRRYIPKDELSEKGSKRKGFPILIEAKEKKDKLKFKVRLFKKRRKLRKVLERK